MGQARRGTRSRGEPVQVTSQGGGSGEGPFRRRLVPPKSAVQGLCRAAALPSAAAGRPEASRLLPPCSLPSPTAEPRDPLLRLSVVSVGAAAFALPLLLLPGGGDLEVPWGGGATVATPTFSAHSGLAKENGAWLEPLNGIAA